VNSNFASSLFLIFGRLSIRSFSFWFINAISSGVNSVTFDSILGSTFSGSSKSSSVKISLLLSLHYYFCS